MKFELKTLTQTPWSQIHTCFQTAFADYFLPMTASLEAMKRRWVHENVDRDLSCGIFVGEEMVGFLLSAIGQWEGIKTAYNAGTGIIPEHRGKGLTGQQYAFLTPLYAAAGIQHQMLEVIDRNVNAIRAYEKAGLKIKRELHSFKGATALAQPLAAHESFTQLAQPDWEVLESWWEFGPAWGGIREVVERGLDTHQVMGYHLNEELIGYGILDPFSKKLLQLAIKPNFRQKGHGKRLLELMCLLEGQLMVINVDGRNKGLKWLLTGSGLEPFLVQYEMHGGLRF